MVSFKDVNDFVHNNVFQTPFRFLRQFQIKPYSLCFRLQVPTWSSSFLLPLTSSTPTTFCHFFNYAGICSLSFSCTSWSSLFTLHAVYTFLLQVDVLFIRILLRISGMVNPSECISVFEIVTFSGYEFSF